MDDTTEEWSRVWQGFWEHLMSTCEPEEAMRQWKEAVEWEQSRQEYEKWYLATQEQQPTITYTPSLQMKPEISMMDALQEIQEPLAINVDAAKTRLAQRICEPDYTIPLKTHETKTEWEHIGSFHVMSDTETVRPTFCCGSSFRKSVSLSDGVFHIYGRRDDDEPQNFVEVVMRKAE